MIKNVMAAVDGSGHAERALALAADMAVKYGAALHLAHVVARPVVSEELKEFASIEHVDNPAEIALAQIGESILGAARASATVKGVRDVRTRVLTGDLAEELLRYARDHGVDLIAMGRRGLGRVGGLLVGSVSSKVSSLAECAVVTVK